MYDLAVVEPLVENSFSKESIKELNCPVPLELVRYVILSPFRRLDRDGCGCTSHCGATAASGTGTGHVLEMLVEEKT